MVDDAGQAGQRWCRDRSLHQFVYEKIEPSKVGSALQALDRKLTLENQADRAYGLREWNGSAMVPFRGATSGKKILLFIHGTFSNCDHVLGEVQAASNGTGHKFLAAARKKYDRVLTFDHPTVGVSPVLNAFELAALLREAPESVDVICHSRGGLVTRWWLEGFADPRTKLRAVLVASPIAGTSLAAPARLKNAINFLTNVGEVLQHGTGLLSGVPFFAFASGILRIINSITRVVAKAPLIDAAVAMIPGLAAQSLAGTNGEILRLRTYTGSANLEYYAVKANFETNESRLGILALLFQTVGPPERLVRRPRFRRRQRSGGGLQFDGRAGRRIHLKPANVLDFGTTDEVHHSNYFRQPKTLEFIRTKLVIP